MFLRAFIYLLITFLALACTPKVQRNSSNIPNRPLPQYGAQLPSQKPIDQQRLMASFNRVRMDGVIDVKLHTGYSKPKLILHGDPRDLVNVITTVDNNTLVIRSVAYPKFGRITADIQGRELNAFSYRGAGVIRGDKINSRLLDLYISNPESTILGGSINLNKLVVKGPGVVEITGIKSPYLNVLITDKAQVKLAGIAKLAKLELKGNSRFNLFWVSSDYLMIRANEANYMQLAGIVNKLDIELRGSARFNGRYLRASRTFVKTFDRAVAEINSVDRQHTLASGASDIRFYNIPVMKNDFMAFNGAVLDMRDWNEPFLQEYNRYNKDIPLGDW